MLDSLEKLEQFIKKNQKIFNEYDKLIKKAELVAFQSSCLKKDYLKECEPEYCVFRLNNECQYFTNLAEIKKITSI